MTAWRRQLSALSGARPCVLGIGNRLRGDDAFGPLVCDMIAGRFGGTVIDAGSAPENHLERVVADASALILVVDAADHGGAVGELSVLEPRRLTGTGLSTHACSPNLLSEYVAGRRADPPTIRWLVIHPASTERLSPAVARGIDDLAQALCELWPARSTT